MSEHDHQKAVCDYLNTAYPDVLYHANPNGAWLAGNKAQRMGQMRKLKGEGLLPGVSDLFIAEPRGQWHGFYLEMKDTDGAKPTENQVWFLTQAQERGYFTAVAYGFEDARSVIDAYLWDLHHPVTLEPYSQADAENDEWHDIHDDANESRRTGELE